MATLFLTFEPKKRDVINLTDVLSVCGNGDAKRCFFIVILGEFPIFKYAVKKNQLFLFQLM